jgi:protein-S-isoprenylcysteine O-methyltransferase Ste14
MPLAALVGWILWALVVLVLRNRLHVARTGKSAIFVRETSRMGAHVRFAGALLVLAKLLVPVTIALAWSGKSLWWDSGAPWARAAALATFVAGLGGTFACQLAMRASWRIGIDASTRTELVTGGPFRYSRNPIYVFVVVSALSLFLALPCASSLAVVVLAAVGFDLHVRWAEEPFLIALHGERYLEWASRTGRFVPGIGKLRAARD